MKLIYMVSVESDDRIDPVIMANVLNNAMHGITEDMLPQEVTVRFERRA